MTPEIIYTGLIGAVTTLFGLLWWSMKSNLERAWGRINTLEGQKDSTLEAVADGQKEIVSTLKTITEVLREQTYRRGSRSG